MDRKTVLVFPCGSEIGLEVHRSLRYSRHIKLIGGSSVNDHGRFVFENYMGGIPFVHEIEFIPHIRELISKHCIDAIYPCMDSVITVLTEAQKSLNCRIISSPLKTVKICYSKKKTYHYLKKVVLIPKVYKSIKEVDNYPVFMKPEVGYGTRGARKIDDPEQAKCHLAEYQNCMILEYLPGQEFTVDCFTNRKRELIFSGPRPRRRIVNGISVNTTSIQDNHRQFVKIAEKLNNNFEFRGAWFFQVKENMQGELVLMEVACRLGGSSSLYRNLGVNFALLSIFDAFEEDVSICSTPLSIEMDRALDTRYKIAMNYEEVYIDLDDCLLIGDRINTQAIAFLYQCLSRGVKLNLLTRHAGCLEETLSKYRLSGLFDSVIHVKEGMEKTDFIANKCSIFIDDSFVERKKVKEKFGIFVLAPDMIESLLD
jgi:hypothetical protein